MESTPGPFALPRRPGHPGAPAYSAAIRQDASATGEAVQASLARRDATQLGQTVGDRTLLDRLNAENDASTAQLALAQARVALLLDHLRLAALAGQLDEAVLTAANQSLESPPSHSTP